MAPGDGAVHRLRRLDYAWRLVATGLAFAALSLGGFLMAVTVIPLYRRAASDPVLRARRAQRLVRASFRLYIFMLQYLGVIELKLVGAKRLHACRGNVVVANHPTLLDIVLIMSLVPDAQCVVKHQLWRHPLLGPLVRAAGYIRNDQNPESLIEACKTALAAGANLIIFPEGTRSVPGRPLRLQRGFAHIAALSGADVQLLSITCEPITLIKGEKWYVIPARRPTFTVEVGEQVRTKDFFDQPSRARAVRRLVSYLEGYYVGKLQHG